MKQVLDINLKKIQYFLCIVKEGSLTKAATSLYVSQPMLSKAMKELEQELEVTLFIREKRTLKLTEAGQYLYEQWTMLFHLFHAQIGKAQDIQASLLKQLHIGCEHIMVLGASDIWMDGLSTFQERYPDVRIDMQALGLQEVKQKLIQGNLDMMICSNFDAMGLDHDFHVQKLCELSVYIYGRNHHPILSKQEHITWADLRNASFYTISPLIATWPQNYLRSYTSQYGYEPTIAGYTDTQMSQLMKIKTSDCLMLSLELTPLLQDDKLCAVKMGEEKTDIMLVWRKDGDPLLHILANILLHKKGEIA